VEFPCAHKALHAGIRKHETSEKPQERFNERLIDHVDHTKKNQDHVKNIGDHRPDADHPSVKKTVFDTFVNLGRIHRSDRCRNGQPQN
jgi:hypothetical protein